MTARDLLSQLSERHLLVVTGKGGVGKTAVAGALGRVLAAAGRRVLVIEVDPRENLHRMLGVPPSGGEVVAAVEPAGLFLQNLRPRRVVDDIVRERLKIEVLARRVLASPVYDHFVEGSPGLEEVAILGHALRQIGSRAPGGAGRGGGFDLVIVDAPATGHGVSLLAAPGLLSEVIERGPFGDMGRELAAFVGDAGRSGVVVVTAAEEMPAAEALELRDTLRRRFDREPDLLVVNGLYPPLPPDGGGGVPAPPADDPLGELWRRRRRLNEAELERLARQWPGPRVELPLLPVEAGPELIAALGRCLREGLG